MLYQYKNKKNEKQVVFTNRCSYIYVMNKLDTHRQQEVVHLQEEIHSAVKLEQYELANMLKKRMLLLESKQQKFNI
jgi:hypothetical protein